jgi:hypothetical protein
VKKVLDTKTKVVYKAFGLSIISEIFLPELPQVDNVTSIDLEIDIKDLSKAWSELSNFHDAFVIRENLVMFQVPNIATFSIQDGLKIFISPLEQFDEDVVRLYLLGTCMAAILLQRRIFPLHGSAVAINGKAYAFTGESGAGKSTLASAFLSKGYHLLSDDVIAVSISKDSIPFVTPSYPQQKLWEDSLINFGMHASDYQSIFGRETKYNIPISSNFFNEPLPLAGIFELVKSNNTNIEIRKIENMDRFFTLFYQTFRNFLLKDLGLMEWHFQTSARIINKIDIYHIKRPVNEFNALKLVSIILNIIGKGNNPE